MVISSLVVEAAPDYVDAVATVLPQVDAGVEVHETVDYKIVVTIEAASVDDSHAIASRFVKIPGVINVNLVYANFEDDETLGQGRHFPSRKDERG